jgi:hypothetical protein
LCRLSLLGASARQNRKHRPTFHRRWPLDNGYVGNAGSDATDLVTRHFGVRRLASPESHFDLYFVSLLEEAARGPDAHLQVVVIGARSNAHLLDL